MQLPQFVLIGKVFQFLPHRRQVCRRVKAAYYISSVDGHQACSHHDNCFRLIRRMRCMSSLLFKMVSLC